ncbi:MAG: hypothetical protein AB7V46_09310 [Thermomicrobiales bacterium]
MINRMDQLAARFGHALTGRVNGDGVVHCDRCNSTIEYRNLLVADWNQRPGATCPNCGSRLDLTSRPETPESPAETPAPVGLELACQHCGGMYRSVVTDVRSGELRPSRFCPHCGHAVTPQGDVGNLESDR